MHAFPHLFISASQPDAALKELQVRRRIWSIGLSRIDWTMASQSIESTAISFTFYNSSTLGSIRKDGDSDEIERLFCLKRCQQKH